MSKEEEVEEPKVDIFSDIAALSKTVEDITPSERILTSLECRKPRKDEFFRCSPDLQVPVSIYEDKQNRVDYLLGVNVLEEMHALVGVKRVKFVLVATYAGDFFGWPLAIPAEVGANRWHSTAYQAAEESVSKWIRITPKSTHYEIYHRKVKDAKEPVWPNEIRTPADLLRLAFEAGGGDYIENSSHDVIKRLKGAI